MTETVQVKTAQVKAAHYKNSMHENYKSTEQSCYCTEQFWQNIIALEANKMTSQQDNITNWPFMMFVSLCWGFTAQSTQWGHVEHGQFT